MSDNRSRYSSAPLQNMKRAPKKSKTPQPPRKVGDYHDMAVPQRSFMLLQLLLTIALPLFFFISLLARSTGIYIAFVLLSSASLAVMWLMSAFVPNARMTLSIIHIAMVMVTLFAIFVSAAPPQAVQPQVNTGGVLTQEGDLASIFGKDSSASISDMAAEDAASQPAGTPNPGSASLAQQRLEQFMSAWVNLDYQEMVNFSIPSWVSQQNNPNQAMFQVRANRTPLDFTVQEVSGSDADTTRTISMETTISKNNGQAPLKYGMQVLMMRLNDVWYVDPSSLSSSNPVQQQVASLPQVTIAPMITASPNLQLYFNPDGGSLYHTDANCSSARKEFLPFKGSFFYSQLSEAAYANLEPCTTCHSPSRGQ